MGLKVRTGMGFLLLELREALRVVRLLPESFLVLLSDHAPLKHCLVGHCLLQDPTHVTYCCTLSSYKILQQSTITEPVQLWTNTNSSSYRQLEAYSWCFS